VTRIRILSLLAWLLFLPLSLPALPAPAEGAEASGRAAGGAALPHPPALAEMVDFWKEVFGRLPTSEVLFHDEENLRLRYGTLRLDGPWEATREQGRAIRARREEIELILRALAEGRSPPSANRRLIEDIRKALAGHPRQEVRRAAWEVRAQPGLRERFREGYIRSGRYLPRFEEIFRRHGVPLDLTLLPHVESNFLEGVYSKAQALGMWQFTRGTGRLFMRVDGVVDGRRDPFLSAEAAARLLKQNHEELGTWPLAITAYNHGAQGIQRAVAHTGSRDIAVIVKNYRGRYFGFASRNFYAEFLASVHVHKNAREYFGAVETDPPLKFDEFPVPTPLPMSDLSRRIGISREVLGPLNPALGAWVMRGRGQVPRGYPLRLPAGQGAQAARAFSRGAPGEGAPGKDPSRWAFVAPGDTLSHIARRHGVSVSALMEANDLRDALIHPGDRLLLPAPARSSSKEAKARPAPGAARPQIARADPPPAPKADPPPAPKKEEAPPAPEKSAQPAPKKEVASARKEPGEAQALRGEALRQALAVSEQKEDGVGVVRVQENETLSHIAEWLEVSPDELRRMNGLGRGRMVQLGRELRVPLGRVSKTAFLERRLSYHQGVKEEFLQKFTVTGTVRHKVAPRENVWTLITRTYNVPLWLVQDYNPGKDLRRMTAGDELLLPVVKPR